VLIRQAHEAHHHQHLLPEWISSLYGRNWRFRWHDWTPPGLVRNTNRHDSEHGEPPRTTGPALPLCQPVSPDPAVQDLQLLPYRVLMPVVSRDAQAERALRHGAGVVPGLEAAR